MSNLILIQVDFARNLYQMSPVFPELMFTLCINLTKHPQSFPKPNQSNPIPPMFCV